MADPVQDDLAIEPIAFSRATGGTVHRQWISPLPVLLGLAATALGVVVVFMLSAKAVRIELTPAPDSVEITRGFSYEVGGRQLMLSGSYSLRATATGHEVLEADFDVGDAADQTVALTFTRLPGILTISTDPVTGAEVFVDQENAGTTPLTFDAISPGLYDISIRAPRYLPYDTDIEIEGKRIEQALDVKLKRGWGNFEFSSVPAGADILVDDVTVAVTPATVELMAGPHAIALRKKGFKQWSTEVNAEAGTDEQMPGISLVVADGTASIRSNPPGANVRIDDVYRGQTPLELVLAPGPDYQLELTRAGFQRLTRPLSIVAENDLQLNLELKPVVGTITLLAEPAGAALTIDGVRRDFQGNGPLTLSLPAREHVITLALDSYATYVGTVTPRPGLAQQLRIRLKTEAEAEAARIPQQIATRIGQELRLVIPGELKMGAGRREPGRRANEIQKDVELTRIFYLGVTEVTNDEFARFDPNHDSGAIGRSLLSQGERPVVNISWDQAVRFCNWLSENDDLSPAYQRNRDGNWELVMPATTGYRLPTEAEWAWSARYSGPVTRFPWGNAMPPPRGSANYADESAAGMVPYHILGYSDTFRGPSPAASFKSNTLGLHDLAGNVAEWVHDYYSADRVTTPLTDPIGPKAGQFHVIRGSSFMHGRFSELRWTYRDYGDEPRPDVGFRIARYIE